MDNFFKRCGIGIVTIVTAPLWLAYFCLYVIYASIMLIISPIKILFYSISKRNYTIKSHYDVEAEARLNNANNPTSNNIVSPFSNINPNFNNQNPDNQQKFNININLVNPSSQQDQNFQNSQGFNPNQNFNQNQGFNQNNSFNQNQGFTNFSYSNQQVSSFDELTNNQQNNFNNNVNNNDNNYNNNGNN